MTKITVLNPPKKEENELKKIEFIGCIDYDGKAIDHDIEFEPSDFKAIDVIIRSGGNEFDLFICKHEKYTNLYMITGHYNDGII